MPESVFKLLILKCNSFQCMTIDFLNNEPNFRLFQAPRALSHVIMQMVRKIMFEGEKCEALGRMEAFSMSEYKQATKGSYLKWLVMMCETSPLNGTAAAIAKRLYPFQGEPSCIKCTLQQLINILTNRIPLNNVVYSC